VPIPVTLSVTLDKSNKIAKMDGGELSPDTIKGAHDFIQTLIANNQLASAEGAAPSNASHGIVKNDKGQNIIRRPGFAK
jgi:hypothetical protein